MNRKQLYTYELPLYVAAWIEVLHQKLFPYWSDTYSMTSRRRCLSLSWL